MIKSDPARSAIWTTSDPDWTFVQEGNDPLRESSLGSRFAISNGFLGLRYAREVNRCAAWETAPLNYVAGLFDTPLTERPIPGLVPLADFFKIDLHLPEGSLMQHPGDPSLHRVTLDMRRGAVLTDTRLATACGLGFGIRMVQLASLEDRHLALQIVELTFDAGQVEVTVDASLVGLGGGLLPGHTGSDYGTWRTRQSGKTLAIAAACSMVVDGEELSPASNGLFQSAWTWICRPAQVGLLVRMIAVARNDGESGDAGRSAEDHLAAALLSGWPGVIEAHRASWAHRWQCSDVRVEGDLDAQKALRFAAYHLNSAANPGDDHVSIGARALTGGDYLGHVFWDTEIFLLPFYTLTWPEAARALLIYRFHTLDGARAKAKRLGWRGALYAWESAGNGAEATPEQVIGPDRMVIDILCGSQEQHISADVAYAVWQYWEATHDEDFLLAAGAEILLETARFWASRALPEADGRAHIRGVIGPDEYHETIDDNAYTNKMAIWNIDRGIDVAALLAARWPARWAELSRVLGLDDAELAHWRAAASAIATGFDPTTGLYEQFAGFYGLEPIDLTQYAGRSVPMDVVLGRKRTALSQIVKQADIVALIGLLPEAFTGETAQINFDYYQPRCSHGSSLSRAMHGLVAARLGRTEAALAFFRDTAAIDLADTHVAIAGGVHIAALGGIWNLAVFGFAGLTIRDDGIGVDPKMPRSWNSMSFPVQWRGRSVRVTISENGSVVKVMLETGSPMMILIDGMSHELNRERDIRVARR